MKNVARTALLTTVVAAATTLAGAPAMAADVTSAGAVTDAATRSSVAATQAAVARPWTVSHQNASASGTYDSTIGVGIGLIQTFTITGELRGTVAGECYSLQVYQVLRATNVATVCDTGSTKVATSATKQVTGPIGTFLRVCRLENNTATTCGTPLALY